MKAMSTSATDYNLEEGCCCIVVIVVVNACFSACYKVLTGERGGFKPRPFHFRRWRPFAYAQTHLLKLTNHNSYFLIYYPDSVSNLHSLFVTSTIIWHGYFDVGSCLLANPRLILSLIHTERSTHWWPCAKKYS